MVIYIRYGLRRGGEGTLQENMYVVRFRHQVLRQQKYTMRQRVASTALSSLARQLCSVQYTILPYLTLPVVILFWLAGVFLAEVRWTCRPTLLR